VTQRRGIDKYDLGAALILIGFALLALVA